MAGSAPRRKRPSALGVSRVATSRAAGGRWAAVGEAGGGGTERVRATRQERHTHMQTVDTTRIAILYGAGWACEAVGIIAAVKVVTTELKRHIDQVVTVAVAWVVPFALAASLDAALFAYGPNRNYSVETNARNVFEFWHFHRWVGWLRTTSHLGSPVIWFWMALATVVVVVAQLLQFVGSSHEPNVVRRLAHRWVEWTNTHEGLIALFFFSLSLAFQIAATLTWLDPEL